MTTTRISFSQQWAGQSSWQSMDACERGYYTQLVLMAAQQQPAGYLPDQDKLWRQWLGLPLKRNKRTALKDIKKEDGGTKKDFASSEHNILSRNSIRTALLNTNQKRILSFFQEHPEDPSMHMTDAMLVAISCFLDPSVDYNLDTLHQGYDEWINHLWIHRWKPHILQGMEPITPDLVVQIPKLKGKTGWWIPIASAIAIQPQELYPQNNGSNQTNPTSRTLQQKIQGAIDPRQRRSLLAKPYQIFNLDDVAMDGLVLLDGDQSKWREITKIQRLWRAALSPERRQSLWEIGVSCLAVIPAEQSKARAFLGKLIGQYGESEVAKAVAELSMRQPFPADPYSFLQALLTRKEEGSHAEQKARKQRSRVAL